MNVPEGTSLLGQSLKLFTTSSAFADGSRATGTVLVAADGANSRVRKQYLPNAQLVETGMLSFGDKVPKGAVGDRIRRSLCFYLARP